MPADIPQIEDVLSELPRLLAAGNTHGARDRVLAALETTPEHPGLNAFAAFICDRLGDRAPAILHARKAAQAGASAPRPVAQAANLLARFRLFDEALTAARTIAPTDIRDPVIADQLGAAYTACGAHHEAERAYAKLVALVPHDPRCRFNLAAAQRFNGRREDAAANLDRVTAADPLHAEAWYARALVEKALHDNNRIDRLRQIGSDPRFGLQDAAAIHYALGKELEDLGNWAEAFSAWSRGAEAMRRARPYRIQPELDAMAETARLWPKSERVPERAPLTPVFIVSLPRAGSTLVDRILSSHPEIASVGETEDFIVSLLDEPALAAARDPVGLARLTPRIDLAAVGQRYRDTLTRRGHSQGVVIDKTPTNFLYAGLIAEALPEARIIHVDRQPMDAALATFKTLFRDRYHWSYDLTDIADYIAAKNSLMTHWEAGWPEHILHVSYETVVRETETIAKQLVAFLGLEWDPACLDFTSQAAPVSTASADQVREPVHDRSIDHWLDFENQLAPVAERLAAVRIG
ncbi:tetratricopeptide repeat-containing sulfotransferase family protein [Hyphobacterium sp.]|uniref:tetratricopeptide repeat-containing sulfotransferase family protein n=1 Tax=Hyphobacterium sp. TaxID=2004662 RepID=UPI003B521322